MQIWLKESAHKLFMMVERSELTL